MMAVTRSTLDSISRIVAPASATWRAPVSTRSTEAPISDLISLAAPAERCASERTSLATTAKPRPCSPARAASTAAFSARMLVWKAMPSITPMMSAILRELSLISVIVATTCETAWRAAARDVGGRRGQAVGLHGGVGALAHGAGELRHRAGGVLQAAGGLLGALAQVLVADGHFLAGGADRSAVLRMWPTSERSLACIAGERLQQLAQLVVAVGVHLRRQVAVGDAARERRRALQRPLDAADQAPAHQRADGDGRAARRPAG